MRLESVKREVSHSGMLEVAQATIKATAKVFDMFANDTYANKPLAIMRETVANGIDAHRAAGRSERPVEVTLPTVFDPTCRIRDFGTGMSHDFVMGPFMAYTDGSTKDGSDKDIGGFGIGSKSPLSYVDQFTLRVVHESVLSVYTLFKGSDGIPAIGLQAQTTTDEPNGVEISFPVEDADIDTFAAAAQEALMFFMPLPIVTNGTLNPPDYTYVGNGWAMRPKSGELGVIMGGVRYPAVKNSMAYDLRSDARVGPLLDYGIDLTMPIGSCGVAMSREALSYTPKTSESLKAALEGLVDDVVKTFANFFDHCPTEWDAMKLLYTETQIGQGQYNRTGRSQLLLSNAKYKGAELKTGFRFRNEDFAATGIFKDRLNGTDIAAWKIDPARSRRSTNCPNPKWNGIVDLFEITPGEIETIIIDDLPRSPKSKVSQRIKTYVDSQPQVLKTIVVRGRNEKDAKLLFKAMHEPTDVVYTSTLPEPVTVAKTKGTNTRPKVRMFTFNGQNDMYTYRPLTNLSPSRSKADAVKEIKYADQPSSGIMVVLNSFDLPAGFRDKMESGIVKYDELVFINSVDEPKLKATFKQFDDVFAERLKKALAAYPELPQRLAVAQHSDFFNVFTRLDTDGRFKDLTPGAKRRPFGKLFEAWRKYVKPLTPDQRKLAPFVKASLPTGVKPDVLTNAIRADQKELVILINHLKLENPEHRGLLLQHL